MDNNSQKLTMTIDELVALGFGGRNTLYRLARQDKLPVPTISVGKRLYVSRLAVQNLVQQSKPKENSNAFDMPQM